MHPEERTSHDNTVPDDSNVHAADGLHHLVELFARASQPRREAEV